MSYPVLGQISFDRVLFESNPWTLGLNPKDLDSIASTVKEYDNHLWNRIDAYVEQVSYCLDYPDANHSSLPWLPDNCKRKGEPILNPKHFDECLQSGISPLLIILNVQSFHTPLQVLKFLGYSTSIDSGMVFWAVNPETGKTDTTVATHFKPDKPFKNTKGKSCKYLCPQGKTIEVVHHNTGNPNYWQQVTDNEVLLTEGTKKALSGLTNNLPTLCALGTWMATDKENKQHTIKEGLKQYCKVTMAYDADLTFKESVALAVKTTGKSLETEGKEVKVVTWEHDKGKGLDDFIVNQGIEAFHECLDSSVSFTDYLLQAETFELKALIDDYNQTYDPVTKIVKERKILKIYPNLRGKLDTIETQSITNDSSNNFLCDINDFMSGDNVGIDWLLPNYFARGALSIIGGDAGSGKSLLCYMLVTALATQGKILGQQVTGKYKSLFIQQDEPKGTTQERLGFANLYKDGKSNPDYKNYVTLNHKSQYAWKATPTGLKLLDKVVEEGGYDFIIIDNLKHVLPNDVDLYHPEVERKILIPLKEIATKHDCHILVLHHTNKGEGLIGSNSIKDSANYVGMLKNKNGYKTLQDIKQRDCPDEQEVTYEVTVNDDGIWTMKVTGSGNGNDLMEANDVPNFHKDLGNHFDNCHRHKKPLTVTVKELEGITGLTRNAIKVKLDKLVTSGHLVQLPTPKNKATVWQATDLFNKDY